MGTGVASTSETGQAHVKPLARSPAVVCLVSRFCNSISPLIIAGEHTEPKAPEDLLRFAQDGVLYAIKVYNAKAR